MSRLPTIIPVSARQYEKVMDFFKDASLGGGAVAITGLAGIVEAYHLRAEDLELADKIAKYGIGVTAVGLGTLAVFGIHYLVNKNRNNGPNYN